MAFVRRLEAARRASQRLTMALVLALLVGAAQDASAQSSPSPEYQLKAVFLYHFTQFVEWPPEAFAATDAPFVIGVMGDDPFGDYLDETVRGEVVAGRTIVAERLGWGDDLERCHILFVSPSESWRQPRLLRRLEGSPVLTVADAEGFAELGGMVEFATERDRIRLRINAEVARAAGLALSSKLLGLARIVTTTRS